MTTNHRARRWALSGAGLTLALSLTACGGNVGGGSDSEEEFPGGDPITMLVGQDPGGSTDLIARAAADGLSDELGVPVTVENRPGANGALAAQQLAGEDPDGHTLMVYNGSLAYITPLAVGEGEAPDIADFDIVTGLSLDDYVLVTAPGSGFSTVEDLAAAGRPITFGTTGVGTGSQLSQELLFAQADIDATAVPFDGGSPTLTAVLGGQVDVGSVQLGEAIEQIESGGLTPIVTFAEERPSYLPDTPTAVEAGYDVPVQQSRAVFAPQGVPDDVMQTLRDGFEAAFETEAYQQLNEDNLLTPLEVDGEEIRERWTENLDNYRAVVEEYGIDLGGDA
ncbi:MULTISPECIES: Bug family tripartite tricarboxylate transporter substrate binding protein [unclassified Modestobacter]|jgi:tripartite-type tricarboxylate transporter receptor subunit TctC|uniref:Bug family tripartite tricarboxylate transporter substrate binding protein n=1 Tax=unclassified Modestobacter TaxID=2643866 RepID=UPI0013E04920|nr:MULTISPECIES: tripartite tricarboxylate transporter substrate binding protein [unclassified Modestobacter]MCZ2811555.1 tripartite tricarboxylate transporter substrate binding protein [Modestobacter sp. VKM Ac-2979]MCZ2843278.1 tripartite tricarboxylate transporter substrate binding protein [Modestobacter sp. VKM Ac-2980]MCZ2848759.1 tripartite tricarboxylate transporter substrate binding protein [Modestobacter sp. VKM Ac-2978]